MSDPETDCKCMFHGLFSAAGFGDVEYLSRFFNAQPDIGLKSFSRACVTLNTLAQEEITARAHDAHIMEVALHG